jgi:hypothetical protein
LAPHFWSPPNESSRAVSGKTNSNEKKIPSVLVGLRVSNIGHIEQNFGRFKATSRPLAVKRFGLVKIVSDGLYWLD